MSRRFATHVAFVLLTAVSVSSLAHAQESSALAQSLFEEGRKLVESRQVSAACPKFEESLRLEFALGTLLNLAECEALAGRTASAWARFGELEEKARRAGQKDRETYARKRLDELASKLSYVELRLPHAAKIERVEMDGKVLGAASYSTPLPIDPGSHVVVVTSAGATYRTTFEAPKDGKQRSTGGGTAAIATGGAAAMPIEVQLDDAHRVSEDKAPDDRSLAGVDGRLVGGWIAVAVGAIGVGVGSYLGARAIMLRDGSGCDDLCEDPTGLEEWERARDHANGATATFAIAGPVLAAGAGVLIWAAVEPRRAASITVVGRF